MSECPYKRQLGEFLELIVKPMKEFNGFPPCPFAAKELNLDKLMIDVIDPEETDIIKMVEKLDKSNYDSALFIQKTENEISKDETSSYQKFLNKILKEFGYEKYRCICLNPNDPFESDGYNIRSKSPYFLVNIVKRDFLFDANRKMKNTKYYDKMNEQYLNYLNVKRRKK